MTDQVGNQDVATSASVVKVGYAAAVNATTGLLSLLAARRGRAVRSTVDGLVHRHLAARAHRPHLGVRRRPGRTCAGHRERDRHRRQPGPPGHRGPMPALHGRLRQRDAGQRRTTRSRPTLVVKSIIAGDTMGVIGRLNRPPATLLPGALGGVATPAGTSDRVTDGTIDCTSATCGSTGQRALIANQSYRLKLEMVGTVAEALRERRAQGLGHRRHAHRCRPGRDHGRQPGATIFAASKSNTTGSTSTTSRSAVDVRPGGRQQGQQPRRLHERRDPRRGGCPGRRPRHRRASSTASTTTSR